ADLQPEHLQRSSPAGTVLPWWSRGASQISIRGGFQRSRSCHHREFAQRQAEHRPGFLRRDAVVPRTRGSSRRPARSTQGTSGQDGLSEGDWPPSSFGASGTECVSALRSLRSPVSPARENPVYVLRVDERLVETSGTTAEREM